MPFRHCLRRTLPVLTSMVMVAVLAGCQFGKSADEPTLISNVNFPAGSSMERLHKARKLTIGVKFDQPGIGQMNPATNTPEGFDIENGKIIAAALGIPARRIKWVEAVSQNRETFLQNGTVDLVIASYSVTPERRRKVSFAGPYYVTGQQMLVRRADNTITGPGGLTGRKVCATTGSTALATIEHRYPTARAVPFATYTECVQQLINGSVDAVSTDGAILLGYAARQPALLKVVGRPFSDEKYGIGLKKGDAVFRDFVNATLRKSFSDGSWAEAFDRTLGRSGAAVPRPPALELG